MENYVDGKTKREILDSMTDIAMVGSQVHEQQKAAILVCCTEDMEKSIQNMEIAMAQSSNSNLVLAKKVFWLNVVLTAATVLGAFFGVLTFFRN
jgi:hypothetical protein